MHVQKAQIGMNYLEESLFYLSTVDWPPARSVPLLTTQETTLIHQPPCCSLPPCQAQTTPKMSQRAAAVHSESPNFRLASFLEKVNGERRPSMKRDRNIYVFQFKRKVFSKNVFPKTQM